jgi:hypothetical protein
MYAITQNALFSIVHKLEALCVILTCIMARFVGFKLDHTLKAMAVPLIEGFWKDISSERVEEAGKGQRLLWHLLDPERYKQSSRATYHSTVPGRFEIHKLVHLVGFRMVHRNDGLAPACWAKR